MLITATNALTLPVYAVWIAISLALMLSLGAVAATLIGRGVSKGSSILRCLFTLNPVSPYPISYSLLELSLESLLHFLRFLDLPAFFLAFCISLEHVLHKSHALIAPKLLVELLGLKGFTCCCLEGLTIAVIGMAVQGVVGLVGTAVGFATLAKLLTATLLRDSTSWAPRQCLALWITLSFRPGCNSFTFCLEFLVLLCNHDSLDSF
jgi:hypothetical protein